VSIVFPSLGWMIAATKRIRLLGAAHLLKCLLRSARRRRFLDVKLTIQYMVELKRMGKFRNILIFYGVSTAQQTMKPAHRNNVSLKLCG